MIIINGRFLAQNITGVQRFGRELLKELDKIIEYGDYKILVPKNVDIEKIKFKNIIVESCGIFKGNIWEQLELPYYVKKNKGILLNLCNTAPIIKPGIITVHDIQTKVYPEFFSKKFSLWYNFLNFINIKKSKKIITVSQFSKNEILKYYKIDSNKVEIIYNGWEHINEINMKEDILEKLNLRDDKYILGVSSLNPNKNFKYILGLSKMHLDYKFVIVGKKNIKIFKEISEDKKENLLWTGYIEDDELKALYKNAYAFVYPSYYEGFGLPPLEAIASGCKNILVSNTSCLPEIYKKYVQYINPYKVEKLKIENNLNLNILNDYSWKKSAEKLKNLKF